MNASMVYYKERIFNEMSTIYSTKEQRDCQLLIYLNYLIISIFKQAENIKS